MAKEKETKSKRQVIREQREKRQKQQRFVLLIGVTVVALVIAALLIGPALQNAMAPVGEVISITPGNYPAGEGTSMGDANAPVSVDIWEDFQCPACKTFSENVEPLVFENYVKTGKVRYTFRHYPFLDDRAATRESDQAANASMCAAEQGRFWDYKTILFANWDSENAGAFRDKRLVAFAESLGLDMTAFNACFDANTYKDQIDEDLAAGDAAGVTGTPSVFVNGQIVKPGFVPSYEELSQAIEAALAASGN